MTNRPRSPSVRQAETTECGLAALAILLGFYGTHVTLEELRNLVGSTSWGVSALTLMDIAERYGFTAQLFRTEVDQIANLGLPAIAHCRFVHFLVVERIGREEVLVNDPAVGPTRVPIEEFSDEFTGIVLRVSPPSDHKQKGEPFSLRKWLLGRSEDGGIQLIVATVLMSVALASGIRCIWVAGNLIAGLSGPLKPLHITAWLSLAAVCLAASWLRDRVIMSAVASVAEKESDKGLDRLGRLPPSFFFYRLSAQIVAKLRAPVEILRQGHALAALFDISWVIALCAYAVSVDYELGCVIVAWVGLEAAVLGLVWGARGRATATDTEEPLACVGLTPEVVSDLGSRLLSGGDMELFSRLAGLHARATNIMMQATVSRIRLDAVRLFIALGRIGVTAAIGLQIRGLSSDKLVQSVAISFLLGIPIERLSRLGGFQDLLGAAHQIADLDDARVLTPSIAEQGSETGTCVSIEELAWRPAPKHPFVFSNLSLHLPRACQLGVTGKSSSGKSVFAQLLGGLLEPSEGKIVIDGLLSTSVSPGFVIVVADFSPILTNTLRENLRLGSAITDEVLKAALHDVHLDRELQSRGELDLFLTHGGLELSGGQRRRLAIARALLRRPKLLVIDEMLDGVDVQLETRIRSSIKRRGITLVLVTGRAESLRQCDKIIDLSDYAATKRID